MAPNGLENRNFQRTNRVAVWATGESRFPGQPSFHERSPSLRRNGPVGARSTHHPKGVVSAKRRVDAPASTLVTATCRQTQHQRCCLCQPSVGRSSGLPLAGTEHAPMAPNGLENRNFQRTNRVAVWATGESRFPGQPSFHERSPSLRRNGPVGARSTHHPKGVVSAKRRVDAPASTLVTATCRQTQHQRCCLCQPSVGRSSGLPLAGTEHAPMAPNGLENRNFQRTNRVAVLVTGASRFPGVARKRPPWGTSQPITALFIRHGRLAV